MKKLLSMILAIFMLLGTFTALVTTASAATNTSVSKTWDFENVSGEDSALLEALGWTAQSSAGTLKASVTDGVLRLQNPTKTREDLLVCDNVALRDGFTLQYDFMYSEATDLPASVSWNDKSYTQYNGKADESAHFSGDSGTGDNNTWHVQPRMNGDFLNSPKNSSWIDTSKMYSRYASTVFGQWFTLRIEFSTDYGVCTYLKPRESETWTKTDYYSAETLATAKDSSTNFISRYLRLVIRGLVDVQLDNISLSPLDQLPKFIGYQTAQTNDTFTLRLITAIENKSGTKVGYLLKVSYYDEATGVLNTSELKNIECDYVYQSITYGNTTKTASELWAGMEYLYVLHISEIPRGVGYTYEITPYEVKNEQTFYGRSVTYSYADFLADVPDYDTSSGTVHDVIEFSAGGFFTRQVEGTSKTEFDAYVTKLTNAGFTLYQSRDNVNGNYFRTFYNSELMVHVYYTPNENTDDYNSNLVRIVASDTPQSAAFPKEAKADATVTEASMTFMSINYAQQVSGGENGLGVVFTNPDGSYVIVDGGWKYDTNTLYKFLKDNNKRTDGRIVIRAWIITHPHEDHWGNIVQFSKSYASQVTLEYFVAQLSQQYCVGKDQQTYNGSKALREAAARFTGAKTVVPQTGQIMRFGELEVEFLYTLESMLTKKTVAGRHGAGGRDANEQSMIFRAKFNEGQTVLITGDATNYESTRLETMYNTHLKSDFVTLPHHGIDPTTETFYGTSIQAKYVLIPTSTNKAIERYNLSKEGSNANYGSETTGGSCVAVDYALANGGAFLAADGGYATFNIKSGYTAVLKTQVNDETNKDAISFEGFFTN
ncbi:MAG: hypothetical protein IJY47_07160 [Clostridia bacterium]|nr:hypothetical protein [Clostridia bacterium]